MKITEFRKLIREEVRKVLNRKQLKESLDNGDYADSAEDEGIYDMLGPVVGKQQKLFDDEYGWVLRELIDLDDMQSFMNRYNSFETPEDIKNFNEGAIEYFTKFITKLKSINNKIK
jgi:hypothetical protein